MSNQWEECNFYDIFGLTADNKYKSRLSLQDKDIYYPKNSIFNYDDKLFNSFICFYENSQLLIKSIEKRKLDGKFIFKKKDNSTEKYSIFENYSAEKNLFRFADKEWIKKAYLEGNFRIKPSIDYMKQEYDEARQDNEHLLSNKIDKVSVIFNSKTSTATNGEKNHIDSNINKYILCMAYEFDERLFDEFKPKKDYEVDMACLVITDPNEFERRLENEINKYKYSVIGRRVYYNDQIHFLGPLLNKKRQYKVQKEFRFILSDLNNTIEVNPDDIINRNENILNKLPKKHIDIYLGSLQDIAVVVDIKGNKLTFDK